MSAIINELQNTHPMGSTHTRENPIISHKHSAKKRQHTNITHNPTGSSNTNTSFWGFYDSVQSTVIYKNVLN